MSRDGVTWTPVPAPPGELFEGPHWIDRGSCFQWVDILGGSLHRWNPYGVDPVESRNTGLEFATMALPVDHDRMLVASRSSLHVYSWDAGTLETVGQWDFPPDVRFNDGGVTPHGQFYVGTMSMDRRPDAGSLYRFDLRSGELTRVLSGIGISNGLCWDSDTTAFYVDSLVPQIDRVEVVDGSVTRSRWALLGPGDEPDGLALNPDGGVVVALWGGSRVELVRSDGCRSAIPVPAAHPTSVAFGGAVNELMFVTTASDEGGPGLALLGKSARAFESEESR